MPSSLSVRKLMVGVFTFAILSAALMPVFSFQYIPLDSLRFDTSLGDSLKLSKMERLKKAYPDFIESAADNIITWKDGTRMIFDDSVKIKDWYSLNNKPDLEDQFIFNYPAGVVYDTPVYRINPGTVRYEPFYKKMYGGTKEEVEANLVNIVWLPGVADRKLKVTTVNNIHERIKAISAELLEKKHLHKYLVDPGGTFNWRAIAGTTQMSMHSFGMAIDINVKYSNYWYWEKPVSDQGICRYKNRIPIEIVEVFERYGFIWGGKWYNFDTMHFEYRPEILT